MRVRVTSSYTGTFTFFSEAIFNLGKVKIGVRDP
jgi:hypothetical protein